MLWYSFNRLYVHLLLHGVSFDRFLSNQDEEVVAIGEGVDVLHEIARAAREEITSQNRMLDTLEQKIDDVHEHVTNVNAQLKTTLEEVCACVCSRVCVCVFAYVCVYVCLCLRM
jgi:uncharacterized protein YlxW (UPF0749 family)